MNRWKTAWAIMAIVTSGAFVTACEKEGPAERMGSKVDEAAEDAGDKMEDACEDAKEKVGAENTNC